MAITLEPPRSSWRSDFVSLAASLHRALGVLAVRIDHIGSTSVPGLEAKDVIDAQVIVVSLEPPKPIVDAFSTAHFELASSDWNRRDHVPDTWTGDPSAWNKLTFGSGRGERPSNIHVRVGDSPNERYALLFRDFLRADDPAKQSWAAFKRSLAGEAEDLREYGMVKDPAIDVLMLAAERWAAAAGWRAQPPR